MSYILEALRRSQAERERGRVPGLDAQPSPAHSAGGGQRLLPVAWIGGGLGLLLLVVVVVLMVATSSDRPRADVSQAGAQTLPATALPSPPAATTALPSPSPAPIAAPATAASPTLPVPPAPVVPPAPMTLPRVVSAPPAPQQPRPASAPSSTRPPDAGTAAAPPAQQPAVAQPTAAAEPKAVALAQLSAEQRREMPAIVMGGSVWSDNAASRFVVINGVVVREGEQAAPGITLEKIAPKGATLRWRDLRVEVPL